MKKNKRSDSAARPPDRAAAPDWIRYFVVGVFVLGVILALWALMQTGSSGEDTARMSAMGWGNYAATIVANKSVALWHAALMTMGAGAAVWLLTVSRWRAAGRICAWLLVLAVACDALWLSRHYIKTMPMAALEENDVIRILKSAAPENRAALVSQDGFYNFWLTYVFPYHHILTMNVTQMPRMPIEYHRYLEAVGNQALRYWQLSAVSFVLAPAQVWTQIQNDPVMQEALEIVYAYNAAPAETGVGIKVLPASPEAPGQHVVMRLKKPAPRFALIAGWQPAGDDEALRQMAAPDFIPFQKALVAPEDYGGLPEPSGTGMVGRVQMVEYRAGEMKLKVSADRPAILRISEKYDRDWRAWIDAQPVPVRRVDFIFQGVLVSSPGLHEVTLKYAPDKTRLIWQWLAILICAGAGLALVLKTRRGEQDHGAQGAD